ncbi:Hypoxia-inducible factor 1-alpha inhibitor [Gryllus bimaculatus]|nr:Hypoxia-inducible factor 1-alpha inhibitor [Gryllus bimaculatus]
MSHWDVSTYESVSEEKFTQQIYPRREPALIKGVDIGPCTKLWTRDYLSEKIGEVPVKVHVSTDPKMDFISKNFVYKTLPLRDLIERAAKEENTEYFLNSHEYYYLRSLGSDPRGREIADVKKQFPNIASDITVPKFFNDKDFFSSVFRIGSSGVQLWTHYDIMDNILIQICGKKRVTLFSPDDALNMYLVGDKSLVIDIDNPDLNKYPRFRNVKRYECMMEPGDILFIPALWFHNALALEFGIAVNIFWKHLPHDLYDKKDPYGNKDLVPAARALLAVENAVKQLDVLPEEYRQFYGKRMIRALENRFSKR